MSTHPQPDLFREDDFARRRRLLRAWIEREDRADEPAGVTPGVGPETYRQYFERVYGQKLEVRKGNV
jgi:hypothetical protein